MNLELDLSGLAEAAGMLDGLASRMGNLRPGLEAVADDFLQIEQELFNSAGRGHWAPDKPATLRKKSDRRVLVDSGGLLDSLTKKNDRYAVRKIGPDTLEVGTKNPVANLLRSGARGTAKRNPIPATTQEDLSAWADILLAAVFGI